MSNTENYKKLDSFFGKEYDRMKSYVHSRISNEADRSAEDIVQDVALKLFSRADSFSPINNVAGFVYRSIKNSIIDALRSKQDKNDLESESESRLLDLMDLLYGQSDNAYSEEMKESLITAIARLKPHYKQIIIDIDFEGMSYKELSANTGVPEGTLMSRRHRALSILNQKLKELRNMSVD